jgi:hypothetical protein
MAVLPFTHVYTLDNEPPLNSLAGTDVLAHTALLVTAFIVGVGFTLMVNVWLAPVQPFAAGVTVTVAVCSADALLLVPVKAGMLPVPDVAKPTVALLFVQLYTVPATLPVKLVAATVVALHTA